LGSALQEAQSTEADWAAYEALGRRLLDDAERSAVVKGLKGTETTLVYGDPATEILALAEATKADMIVMGSRGLSNLKGLLVGSVSHKVMNLAKCTCVTEVPALSPRPWLAAGRCSGCRRRPRRPIDPHASDAPEFEIAKVGSLIRGSGVGETGHLQP
jgi:hypothetical protein